MEATRDKNGYHPIKNALPMILKKCIYIFIYLYSENLVGGCFAFKQSTAPFAMHFVGVCADRFDRNAMPRVAFCPHLCFIISKQSTAAGERAAAAQQTVALLRLLALPPHFTHKPPAQSRRSHV